MSSSCFLGFHDWKKDCEKCSICGTKRYEKHKWHGMPEECSICGALRSGIVEWDQNSEMLLLFHWNKFEFEGKIIYRRVGKEIKIILQSIYCDFTETYAPTSKRVVEKDIEVLSTFLEKFTQNEFWFLAKPQYIHESIKSFFTEQITQIDTSKLSQRDSQYLVNWHKILELNSIDKCKIIFTKIFIQRLFWRFKTEGFSGSIV